MKHTEVASKSSRSERVILSVMLIGIVIISIVINFIFNTL